MHAPAKLRHIQSMLARYDNNSWLYYGYVESGNYTQACYDKKVEKKMLINWETNMSRLNLVLLTG